MVDVRRKECESKAALLSSDSSLPSVVVGTGAEAPRKFYSIHVESELKAWRVAVISSGLGTEPDLVILDEKRAVVGHDTWLTWIDVDRVEVIFSRRLGGVFFEFVADEQGDRVVAVHELGALKVNGEGGVVWSVDTDIVEGFRVEDGSLLLSVMDQPGRFVISLDSGALRTL